MPRPEPHDVAAARCHALCVRLPGPPSETQDVFSGWWPENTPRLWLDRIPAAAGSAAGERALRSELRRPVEPGSPVLRAVCLVYSDGPADLVLVARRSALDVTSLQHIADVVAGKLAASELRTPADSAPDAEIPGAGEHAWATKDPGGRTGEVSVVLDGAHPDAVAMVVVAAGIVLGRYTAQAAPEVLVAGAAPDRPAMALGSFDHLSALRLDLSGETTVGGLVDLLAHPVRTEPTAATLAVLAPGCDVDGYLACQAALCSLTLVPRASGDRLTVTVHHRRAEIDEASAGRFASHLAHVHAQLLASERTRDPRELDLTDAAEAAALAALGRPSGRLGWHPDRIDRVFARQAAAHPDATAVSYEDETLTYAQLAERSTRLAAGLVGHGVRPGDRVGVCLDRGLDLVVTLLAVLKADGVYVPMDPAYPADRLAHTVEDADLRLVVTDLAEFPGGVAPASPAVLSGCDVPLPAPSRGADDAAYVIYTSGSTGRPKGVVVPHRNVLALLAATAEDFGFGRDDVWTLFHSAAFDFSVWEIWGALLTGGHLVVVPYWVSRSPAEFRALLAARRVTVLNQTPSAFTQLMAADAGLAPLPLRLVVFGGEALDPGPLRGWFDRYPETRCRLVNMYGITETTVHVTAQTLTRRESLSRSRSVGPPLPGWHLYVLDEQGRTLPVGVPGEIYVGGEGVASGYLGKPGLTAQRFLPDPCTGGRMYRSGDQGRLLADGRLEHLGRLDNQVKIRGFRIELGEIRGVLQQCAGVRDAAVVVGGRTAGDTAALRIDAYVVLDDATTATVRQQSAKILPDYMMPATITSLPALPLTANGKLDTAGLPSPELGHGETGLPRSTADDLDRALLEIWEEVLGTAVGPDDTFFTLGGNSLYAVRLDAAMQERGLPALSLRELYLNPTVRGLASVLRKNGHQD